MGRRPNLFFNLCTLFEIVVTLCLKDKNLTFLREKVGQTVRLGKPFFGERYATKTSSPTEFFFSRTIWQIIYVEFF